MLCFIVVVNCECVFVFGPGWWLGAHGDVIGLCAFCDVIVFRFVVRCAGGGRGNGDSRKK